MKLLKLEQVLFHLVEQNESQEMLLQRARHTQHVLIVRRQQASTREDTHRR